MFDIHVDVQMMELFTQTLGTDTRRTTMSITGNCFESSRMMGRGSNITLDELNIHLIFIFTAFHLLYYFMIVSFNPFHDLELTTT